MPKVSNKANHLNQPEVISFADGSRIENRYTSDGRKWQTTLISADSTQSVTRYLGEAIVRDGSLAMLRVDGGYLDANHRMHYYVTDYQGNITHTISSTGHIEQAINYYPDGEPWIEPTGDNPFMFGGKERITFGNLRQYDFGARMYNPAVGFWWQQDPKAEDYYPISQYVYCGGNPVMYVDPDGKDNWKLNEDGTFTIICKTEDNYDVIYGRNNATLQVDKNFLNSEFKSKLNANGEQFNVSIFNTNSNGSGTFEFLTSNSSVEWSHGKTLDGKNFLGTSHKYGSDLSYYVLISKFPDDFIKITTFNHSHTNTTTNPSKGDVDITEHFSNNIRKVNFNIFAPNATYNVPFLPSEEYDPSSSKMMYHPYTPFSDTLMLKPVIIMPKIPIKLF